MKWDLKTLPTELLTLTQLMVLFKYTHTHTHTPLPQNENRHWKQEQALKSKTEKCLAQDHMGRQENTEHHSSGPPIVSFVSASIELVCPMACVCGISCSWIEVEGEEGEMCRRKLFHQPQNIHMLIYNLPFLYEPWKQKCLRFSNHSYFPVIIICVKPF